MLTGQGKAKQSACPPQGEMPAAAAPLGQARPAALHRPPTPHRPRPPQRSPSPLPRTSPALTDSTSLQAAARQPIPLWDRGAPATTAPGPAAARRPHRAHPAGPRAVWRGHSTAHQWAGRKGPRCTLGGTPACPGACWEM